MTLGWDAERTIQVCVALRTPIDGARLRNLTRRIERDQVGVAVIGLISRGKSTLVNELLGVDLCMVSPTPETATVVAATSGEPHAWGRTRNGETIRLPTEPVEFCAALRRADPVRYIDAEYVGELRIPHGLTLIDTPGIGEAHASSDDQLARLQTSWTSSGAIGAIHVLSYPPGVGDADLRLLEAARATFNGNIQVVLKATDSTVTVEQLREVSEDLRRAKAIETMILDHTSTTSDWGKGSLQNLEDRIDRFVEQGERARAADETEISVIVADAVEGIEALGEDQISLLEAATRDLQGVQPTLAVAIAARATSVRSKIAGREADAKAQENARLIALLDDSARRLATGLPADLARADVAVHAPTYRELIRLASEGSPVAVTQLRGVFGSIKADRDRFSLGFSSTLGAIPEHLWATALREVKLVPSESLELVELANTRPGTVELVREVVLWNCRRKSSAAKVRPILAANTDPLLAVELADFYFVQVLRELEQICSTWTWIDASSFSGVKEITTLAKEVMAREISNDAAELVQGEIAHQLDLLMLTCIALLNRYGSWCKGGPVLNRREWDKARDLGWRVAKWVCGNWETAETQELRRYFANGGSLSHWADLSQQEVQRAQGAAARTQSGWELAHVASFCIWGISILMLAANPVLAFFLWIGSFVLWLVARKQKELLPDWRSYYLRPTPGVVSVIQEELQ